MPSKYGFETPEDRMKELEDFLRRPSEVAVEEIAQAQVAAQEVRYDKLYRELDYISNKIDAALRDVLVDFERAKGVEPNPQARKLFMRSGHLHYWKSTSIDGLYLQWMFEDDEALLTLALLSPPDRNTKKLAQVLERSAKVRVLLRQKGALGAGGGDIPDPFSPGVVLDESR